MKNWGLFIIGFGLFMIMYAPTLETSLLAYISGFFFVGVGGYMYRKGGVKQ